jgi:hypothetical protein
MSEFTTKKAASPYNTTGPGWGREVIHDVAIVELPTTALQTGDITWLMYVPAGAVIVDGYVKADAIDTGSNLQYNIGDSATTNLFFADTTTGQEAVGSSSMAVTARYTKFASATRLKMTVATTAETAVGGTLAFGLSYFVDPEINVTTGVTPVTITA